MTAPLRTVEKRVRFAHVDAAGIVYYPRFVELLSSAFPTVLDRAVRQGFGIRFRGPAKLGDRLLFEHCELMEGTHSITVSSSGTTVLEFETHSNLPALSKLRPAVGDRVFRQNRTVEPWMCGPDGRLHLSRYFELLSDLVEDWFGQRLNWSFYDIHQTEDRSVPTVQFDTRIGRLPKENIAIEMTIAPRRIGTKSIELDIGLVSDDKVLVHTRQVLVLASFRDARLTAEALPESLRIALRTCLDEAGPE